MIGISGADARLLMRSAVPTAIAGAVALVIGALVAGGRGALGAILGVAVVVVFFTISMVVVGWVSRAKPAALMPTALGTFLAKILLLLGLIAVLHGTTVFNTKVFGFTAIACVLVWSAGQVATLARKMPYVEPVPGPAAEPGAAAEPAAGTPAAEPAAGTAAAPAGAPGDTRERSVSSGRDR